MTLKGGPSQACAACKYQRRKCDDDCPFARYFPADQPKLFQNAHKLFGVRNMLRILKDLDQDQQSEAMRSIIYESNMRDRFPVNGCVEVMRFLRWQLRAVEEELRLVSLKLKICSQRHVDNSSTYVDDLEKLHFPCSDQAQSCDNVQPQPFLDSMDVQDLYFDTKEASH